MNLFYKYCLRETNLDSLFFLFIFLLVPYILILSNQIDTLILYWPYLIGIAKTFSLLSEHNFFKNLYPSKPKDLFGYISKYAINTIVLVGILYHCNKFITEIPLTNIVLIGLSLFSFSYIIIPYTVEFTIKKGYQKIKDRNQYYGLYKFILGLYTTIVLILIQTLLIYIFKKFTFKI